MTITTEDIIQARKDQQEILQATGNEHSVKDLIKSLDCPITDKGIAERILIDFGKDIKFDRATGQFLIRSDGEFKKTNVQMVRDIVAATINNLPKEIRIINDAQKANILKDTEDHKKAIIRYVEQSNPSVIFGVVTMMKVMLSK